MASSVSTGAVYGDGIYGSVNYGQSNITITVDGVASTASAGALSVTAASNTELSVSLIGFIITDAPGVIGDEVVVSGDANTSVTGVFGTSQTGTVAVSHNARPTFSGVSTSSSLGTITLETNNFIVVDSVIGQFGTFIDDVFYPFDSFEGDVLADANVSPTGVTATTTNGGVTQRTENTIVVSGVSATGTVDSGIAVSHNARPDFIGVEADALAGTVEISGDCNTSVSGVEGTGAVGDSLTLIGEANVTPLPVLGQFNLNEGTVSAEKNPITISNLDPDRVVHVVAEEPRVVYVKAA